MNYLIKITYKIFLFSSLLIPAFGCSSDENEYDEVYIWVGPELKQTFDGHGEVFYYMNAKVLFDNQEDKYMGIPTIIGFNYEEGYTYILLIKIEDIIYENIVSPEAPRKKYTLLKTVLKEKV